MLRRGLTSYVGRKGRVGPCWSSTLLWIAAVLCVVIPRPGGAYGQDRIRLQTRVSTDSVLVGERFVISLVAEHGPETSISFPPAGARPFVFGELEVLDRTSVQRRREGGRTVDRVAYEVTTFALDSLRVPALPVRVATGPDTTIRSAPSRSVVVVSVVGADAKGIHGVAPPLPFPRPVWTWVLLVVAGVGLLAGLLYLWWRRKASVDSHPQPRTVGNDQTPYEAATSWMRQLEDSYDLSDPSAIKPFYVELSNAVRVYLARDLGVAALERTTREVVQVLEHRPDVPASAANRIRAVLQLADLVKFADIRPSTDDHEKALREARAALDTIEAASQTATRDEVDGVASTV